MEYHCNCPSQGTARLITHTESAQQLYPEGVWGPRLRNKSEKQVRGRRPHTFFHFLGSRPPPDTLVAQFEYIFMLCLFAGLLRGVDNCKGARKLRRSWLRDEVQELVGPRGLRCLANPSEKISGFALCFFWRDSKTVEPAWRPQVDDLTNF